MFNTIPHLTTPAPPYNSVRDLPKCLTKEKPRTKPLLILRSSEDYPRWKSYVMSKLRKQGWEWTINERERSTIKSIWESLIGKGFTNTQLKPNILINAIVHEEKKNNLAMSKAASIISELLSDPNQPIIEGKSPPEACNTLQKRFQQINPMSTSRIIYKATKKNCPTLRTCTITQATTKPLSTKSLVSWPIAPLTLVKAPKCTFKPLFWWISEPTTLLWYQQSQMTGRTTPQTWRKRCFISSGISNSWKETRRLKTSCKPPIAQFTAHTKASALTPSAS